MEKRRIEEKILWIDSKNMVSGTTNNFINIQIYNENNTVLTDTNVAAPLLLLIIICYIL